MSFIPFMLCERLTDPAWLSDRRYVAEPKLDGAGPMSATLPIDHQAKASSTGM